jgi:hypothetical protein
MPLLQNGWSLRAFFLKIVPPFDAPFGAGLPISSVVTPKSARCKKKI